MGEKPETLFLGYHQMKRSFFVRTSVAACSILLLVSSPVMSQNSSPSRSISESGNDTEALLRSSQRKKALLSGDPLQGFHGAWTEATKRIYDQTGIDFGAAITGLYQGSSRALADAEDRGFAIDYDLFGRWDLLFRNTPWQGALYFASEARVPHTDIPPAQLRQSIGSVLGTIDGFNDQPYLLTNLFWRQGSKQAGWIYQLGRFSPDGVINVSQYNNPNENFHPIGLVGSLTISFPAHGIGAAGVVYPTEDTYILGLINDANGDKRTKGHIERGEFFKAVEIGFKPNYQKSFEGRHSITFWHVDERERRGVPEGHGIAVKLEQDLTRSGNTVGMLRYSKSFGGASLLDEQASAYLIFKNITRLDNDMLGFSVGWADPTNAALRDEKIAEIFYRFPFTPFLDLTTSVQSIWDPAATQQIDQATVGSIRFRKTF
jgi:porin